MGNPLNTIVLALIFICLGIVCLGAISSINAQFFEEPSDQSALEYYSNQPLGFGVQVPSGWSVQEQNDGVKLVQQKDITYIDVRVEHLKSAPSDIEEHISNFIEKRKNDRKDFKLIQLGKVQISGNPESYKAVYTFERTDLRKGEINKVVRYWTLNQDLEYSIAYVSELSNYEQYLTVAEEAIKTFKVDFQRDNISVEDDNINQENSNPGSNNLLEFQSEIVRVKLKYPSDWEKQESANSVRFISPLENNSDTFRETVEINKYPLNSLSFLPSGNMTLDELSSAFQTYYGQSLPNFELINSYGTALSLEREARGIQLSYDDAQTGKTSVLNVIAKDGNDIFVVSFYSLPSSYESFLPLASKIIDSIEIL